MYQHRRKSRIFVVLTSHLVFSGSRLDAVYYKPLKPSETITGDRCQLQLMRFSQSLIEKRQQFERKHITIILLDDSVRPPIAKLVKT